MPGGAFSCWMSSVGQKWRKLGFAELREASSAGGAQALTFERCGDARRAANQERRVSHISCGAGPPGRCCFHGLVNVRLCNFKIDTGSDISVFSARLAIPLRQEPVEFINVKYSTSKKVPIIARVFATVSLGKFCVGLSIFVADIADDCILGEDFLFETELSALFEGTLGLTRSSSQSDGERGFIYSRLRDCLPQFPWSDFKIESFAFILFAEASFFWISLWFPKCFLRGYCRG